ncbi:lactoylglutathione lyase [Duganella sp. FT135W]|uniref:Aldoketomutase n=1 Tax=Duganella flavida TaxID=2692175 RepID=A0A6L8KHQ9_9BURK|nr:lactoylglutathione lyase [Duganella flavida]MYM26277.1 lactoylglutathione lyase [Duganella flavida]
MPPTNDVRPLDNARLLHTMFRVTDLNRSVEFYTHVLRMKLIRLEQYPQGRFSLAFIGYGQENEQAVLELTHNWDTDHYEHGTAWGHVAVAVTDLYETVTQLRAAGVTVLREPGPMSHGPADGSERDVIAFIADPDGYRIELIEARVR